MHFDDDDVPWACCSSDKDMLLTSRLHNRMHLCCPHRPVHCLLPRPRLPVFRLLLRFSTLIKGNDKDPMPHHHLCKSPLPRHHHQLHLLRP